MVIANSYNIYDLYKLIKKSMKKNVFLISGIITLTSCSTDYYIGDERTVLEGVVVSNGQPLYNAKVEVFPTGVLPETGSIEEINRSGNDYYWRYIDDAPISIVTTDQNGKISLSFPRNTGTSVYYIKITKNNNVKEYGYISAYNTMNYYVNVGTLNF